MPRSPGPTEGRPEDMLDPGIQGRKSKRSPWIAGALGTACGRTPGPGDDKKGAVPLSSIHHLTSP
ncbi:hypothetical protein FRZ61_33350 [Hypericibacter adhaerens]|uniref:Uncharacterized protein n=1 Tax=Hypericibacter adhaerens TaxID=2602016 RepID=A0A5J6N1N3_9PROT|nr:hypothetical protein FRZ61_33350 [Hypericibacter adhaerens]